MPPHRPYNPALHRVAVLTAVATFPLIFVGGLVTTKGAGMSVPDWPNSYGYNMFLFPPNQWVGGILYEHTHRLMATVVGFCAIVLTALAWGPSANATARRVLGTTALCSAFAGTVLGLILVILIASKAPNLEQVVSRTSHSFVLAVGVALVAGVCWLSRRPDPRRWARWLCTGVLLAVVFQGVLGGLRVVWVELRLAVVHACFAQAFFCLATLSAFVTSTAWHRLGDLQPLAGPTAARVGRWAIVAVAAVYLQLVAGATMRHYDAGLAIPDLPLHYGKVLPPTSAADLDAANLWRANSGEPELHLVTMAQVWLHAGHRAGAVVVTVVLSGLIVASLRRRELWPAVRTPALLLSGLLLIQLTLGVLTVLLRKPADVASLHVACGALVLVTTVLLGARAMRVRGLREAPAFAVGTVGGAGRAAGDAHNDAAVAALVN